MPRWRAQRRVKPHWRMAPRHLWNCCARSTASIFRGCATARCPRRRDCERIMTGIHHVTAISGGAARNLDFYTRTLGLRFVKRTVNFDDPGTYHLYYGDRVGHPGTILTFFPWDHAAPGRGGVGLTQQTAFRIPAGAIGYWTHRLIEKGVAHEVLERRFGEPVLSLRDP